MLFSEKALVPVKNCVIVSQTAGNSLYKGGSLNRGDGEKGEFRYVFNATSMCKSGPICLI